MHSHSHGILVSSFAVANFRVGKTMLLKFLTVGITATSIFIVIALSRKMTPFNLANYLLKRRNVFVCNLRRILFVTPSVTRIDIGRNRITVVRSWAHDDLDHEPRLLLLRNKNYYVQDEETKKLGEDKIHKFLSVFLHANVSLNILFHSGVITSHSYSALYCFNFIYVSFFIIKYNYIITVSYNILASIELDLWQHNLGFKSA